MIYVLPPIIIILKYSHHHNNNKKLLRLYHFYFFVSSDKTHPSAQGTICLSSKKYTNHSTRKATMAYTGTLMQNKTARESHEEQLIAEMEELKVQTRVALEQAWAEVERLEFDGHRKDQLIEGYEDQVQDLQATVESLSQQLQIARDELEKCQAEEEGMNDESIQMNSDPNLEALLLEKQEQPQQSTFNMSTASVLTNFNIFNSSFPSNDAVSCITSPTTNLHHDSISTSHTTGVTSLPRPSNRGGRSRRSSHSPIRRRATWSTVFGFPGDNNRNRIGQQEADLLRQLEVLQQDKNSQICELELKLKQREQAIDTLEQTVIITSDTVDKLRDEMILLQPELPREERPPSTGRSEERSRVSSSSSSRRRASTSSPAYDGSSRRKSSVTPHRRHSGGRGAEADDKESRERRTASRRRRNRRSSM